MNSAFKWSFNEYVLNIYIILIYTKYILNILPFPLQNIAERLEIWRSMTSPNNFTLKKSNLEKRFVTSNSQIYLKVENFAQIDIFFNSILILFQTNIFHELTMCIHYHPISITNPLALPTNWQTMKTLRHQQNRQKLNYEKSVISFVN